MAKSPKAAKIQPLTYVSYAAKIDVNDGTPVFYVNYAEVAFTEHEFAISFARMPSKPSMAALDEAQRTGEIIREAEVQILLPTSLMPAFMKAMQLGIDGFEKTHRPLSKKDEK